MDAITGIFASYAQARAATRRLASLVRPNDLSVLTPASSDEELEAVPTTEDMPPVGAPMGATVAGALGVAVAFAIPGIGQVAGLGAAAAALLGALGGVAGWKAGQAADRVLSHGLPKDELYIYRDALRQGHSVVIALVEDPELEPAVRAAMELAGAENVDAARQRWWLGLRDAEAEHYEEPSFDEDEPFFRHGFIAGARHIADRPETLPIWPLLDDRERVIVQRGFTRGRSVQEDAELRA